MAPRVGVRFRPYTLATVADLPLDLPPRLAAVLTTVADVEGKIVAALEALGPIAGRDVAFVGTPGGPVRAAVAALAASVTDLPADLAGWDAVPEASLDVVIGLWSAFRGVDPAEQAAVDRVLRPEGRLLVVHDYGRDDVSLLRGDLPEYGTWTRRNGPFLTGGFRVRVIHCFWTFPSVEAAQGFLAEVFQEAGAELGGALRRPRLSWNVAVYHRSRLLPSA